MMAVYIDKDQMYFWVIITESHQYILSVFQSLILTQFFVLFPFLSLTGMMKLSTLRNIFCS